MKPLPEWKKVPCPTCGVPAGEACVTEVIGVPWLVRTVPAHVARRRKAEQKVKK